MIRGQEAGKKLYLIMPGEITVSAPFLRALRKAAHTLGVPLIDRTSPLH